jgi:hypothetical protein
MFFGSWWDDDAARADAAGGDQLAQAKALDPRFATFFDANYPYAARVAAKYGVDPTLLLGVAALESSYGTSDDAQKQNNPLGMRPNGHTPVAFPSTEAAWEEWGRQFGPRVLGLGGDVATFLNRLQEDHRQIYGPTQGGDYRGPYNTENALWKRDVAGTIAGIRRRLPLWQVNPDNAP